MFVFRKSITGFVIFLFFLTFSPQTISAAIYYVSPSGNNSSPGTSEQPWATPGYGSRQLQPGDTLTILGGRYTLSRFDDDIIIPPSGSADALITIKGEPGNRPVLAGSDNLLTAIILSNKSYITIENLEITSDNGAFFRDGIEAIGGPANHIVLKDLYIHHIDEFGINIADTNDIQILDSTITYCGFGSIGGPNGSHGGWTNALIKRCDLSYSGHHYQGGPGPSVYSRPDGFGIEPSNGPIEIADTLASHNYGDGLDSKAKNTNIHHCIVANNSCDGVKLWGDGSKIENTLIYGRGDSDPAITPWASIVIQVDQTNASFEIINVTVQDPVGGNYPMYVQYNSTVPINLTIRNSIFYATQAASNQPSPIYIGGSVNLVIDHSLFHIENSPDRIIDINGINYSCQQINNGDIGTGNICADPLFVSPAWGEEGDYHLQAGSPAIDAASSNSAPATDLDYNQRPSGKGYDIGAYEYLTLVVSCLGDSVTNGYPYGGTENTYPARLLEMLEAAYGSISFEMINHGDVGHRADQVLADLQSLNWMAGDDPDLVLLMVGGNDLAQEVNWDRSNLSEVIAQTVSEVQAIVDTVTAHTNPNGSYPQIIVSAFIPNMVIGGSEAIALYNNSLENDLTGVDLWFTDNWNNFYSSTTGQAKAALMFDLVHPNADGYVVMAENWFQAIAPLVEGDIQKMYFPHIASQTGTWKTEICVINTSVQTVNGVFKAYSNTGEFVSEINDVSLAPHGRKEITVGDDINGFTDPADIGYVVFESDSSAVVGYTKFYKEGLYRVAVPAVPDSEINTGDIYISHIASGGSAQQPWYTGVSLLNTTSSDKTLTIEFGNDETKIVSLTANEHKAFTIRSLFDGQPQPGIKSGVVKDASGVIGLELFTNNSRKQMSGILLKDDTTTSIYYPHTASEGGWTTGIVAYNPSDTSCNITITPYTEAGNSLTPTSDTIAGKEKYIGVVSALGLPEDTAWFQIEATSPITGFELFTQTNQMGGYTGVGISGTEGVFGKLESDGYTGIAFVNIENSSATVTLTAYDDIGTEIATEVITLNAHEKVVSSAEGIFTEDISNATYIAYSSNKEVVGFQLNISSDGMMLDGLPGM